MMEGGARRVAVPACRASAERCLGTPLLPCHSPHLFAAHPVPRSCSAPTAPSQPRRSAWTCCWRGSTTSSAACWRAAARRGWQARRGTRCRRRRSVRGVGSTLGCGQAAIGAHARGPTQLSSRLRRVFVAWSSCRARMVNPPPPPLGPCPARIEDMRRSIGVADPNSGADELQLVELVGEGTFGKVYKGERRRARGTGSSRGAGRPPSTHLPPPCTASQASGAAPRSRSRPWVRGAMRRGIDARTKPGSASPNSFCVFFRPLLSWRPDPPLLPPHSRPPHTVLPAKMSGAEKRERMAIMEAAISSAMNHPNIVRGRDGVSHARGRRRWMGARVFVRWECGQLYAQQLNAPRCPSALQVQTYTYTIRPTTSINVPAGLE